MCNSMRQAALDLIDATQLRYTGHLDEAASLLAEALRQAQADHKAWEAEHGTDPDWPLWYAKYLLDLDVTPEGHDHDEDLGAVPFQVVGYGVVEDGGW